MPKINVYLPDGLAEAVKDTGVPVSAICQRALEQAVRRITAIRQTALGQLSPDDLSDQFPLFTARARAVVKLAIERARADRSPNVGTGHLLAGMVGEGGNLALEILRAMEIDTAQVSRELARQASTTATEPGAAAPPTGPSEGEAGGDQWRFSTPAAGALELAVTEATSFGHNYVGCEHLLLGLTSEPDGTAGQVLRALGAEARLTRRAVTAALAGYGHLRAQATSVPTQDQAQALAVILQQQLQPLIARIEWLEHQLPTPH